MKNKCFNTLLLIGGRLVLDQELGEGRIYLTILNTTTP